jgi:putative oxidoreductase
MAAWTSSLLSVLRAVAGFLFVVHGTQKLFGFPAPMPGGAELSPLVLTAGVIEVAGGVLLLLGLLTRPVAFVLSGEMAFAYFKTHAPQGFWPLINGGELAVLYCFLFLFIAAAGPGPWSVDALMRPRATQRPSAETRPQPRVAA